MGFFGKIKKGFGGKKPTTTKKKGVIARTKTRVQQGRFIDELNIAITALNEGKIKEASKMIPNLRVMAGKTTLKKDSQVVFDRVQRGVFNLKFNKAITAISKGEYSKAVGIITNLKKISKETPLKIETRKNFKLVRGILRPHMLDEVIRKMRLANKNGRFQEAVKLIPEAQKLAKSYLPFWYMDGLNSKAKFASDSPKGYFDSYLFSLSNSKEKRDKQFEELHRQNRAKEEKKKTVQKAEEKSELDVIKEQMATLQARMNELDQKK